MGGRPTRPFAGAWAACLAAATSVVPRAELPCPPGQEAVVGLALGAVHTCGARVCAAREPAAAAAPPRVRGLPSALQQDAKF